MMFFFFNNKIAFHVKKLFDDKFSFCFFGINETQHLETYEKRYENMFEACLF